jgi:hypothetical protein
MFAAKAGLLFRFVFNALLRRSKGNKKKGEGEMGSGKEGTSGVGVGTGQLAARSHKPKAAALARFKGDNTRRPTFFSAYVCMALPG